MGFNNCPVQSPTEFILEFFIVITVVSDSFLAVRKKCFGHTYYLKLGIPHFFQEALIPLRNSISRTQSRNQD